MNYNKHFEAFINNDSSVRKYFNVKIGELKKKYKHLFKAAKVGNNGITLRTGKTDEETEKIKNEAKELLRNYYVFNNLGVKQDNLINNQGKTVNDKFKVLEQYKNIMMDTNLKVNERVDKIKESLLSKQGDTVPKTDLTDKQIEQYIYRNYSSYKYVKPIKETHVKEEGLEDKPHENLKDSVKKVYYVKRPLKFEILLNDEEIMTEIKKNKPGPELVKFIKNKITDLPFDDRQLLNFVHRYKNI